MRLYRFSGADIAFDAGGGLSMDTDPKLRWAQLHPEFFPVNINRADKYELLRVPGIGPRSASRIVSMRRQCRISSVDNLPMRRAWLERAKEYVIAS